MSTLCLPPRPLARISPSTSQRRHDAEDKLRQIEEAVLATILDRHPQQEDALTKLIEDIAALPDQTHANLRHENFTPRQVTQMRELLLAVARGARDRRDRALNELLSEIDPGEARQREEFDVTCDNDPDGLG